MLRVPRIPPVPFPSPALAFAFAFAFALALALSLGACAPAPGPEAEIRALVAEAEAAAEARDLRALARHLADDYQDGEGRRRADLERVLRGWLLLHPELDVVTRIRTIELHDPEFATLRVDAGVLGRGGDTANRFAADLQELELTLRRDGGRWRVTSARWRSPLRS